jgi:PAS domain S-box-containing protein
MNRSESGRLLVVDDEVEILTPLCDLLSEWGYEVTEFTRGKDALKALKEQKFDLLLADLVMPEMDGIELLKEALKIAPHLVCIIITGKGTIQTAVEAMKVGAFDFIVKPLDWKLLKLILSRAIEVRRLRETEEKYRSIVEDYQTEFICRFLSDGTLTFVNDAYCRYFGKKREELVGHSFMFFILEEDRAVVRHQIDSIGFEKPVVTYEHRVVLADGETRWQRWTDQAIFDKQNNIIEFQSVGCDITERKRMEEALRESEELFRAIFNTAKDSIFIKDYSLRYQQVNPSMGRLLGVPVPELIGKNDGELFGEEEAKHIREIDSQVLKGEIVEGEHTKPIKGIMRTFHHVKVPLRNTKSEIIGLCGIARDITDRKRAEEALRESEGKLNAMLQSIGDHMSMLDKDLNIIWANETAKRIFGSDIIGRKCYEAYHGRREPCEPYPCLSLKAFRDGKVHEHDTQILDMEGKVRYFHCTANVALRDKEGVPTAVIEISRDITERKHVEEKLKTASNEWRITFDSVSDQIMLLNSEMEIIKANLATVKFLGRPFNKILGKDCCKLLHGKEMIPAECLIEKMKRAKKHEEAELYLSERDIWIRISVDPVFDDKGNLIGSVHISRDVTAYKKMGESLKWRLEFEKIIANISSRFVEDSDVDKSIYAALRDMGTLNEASRAYLFLFSEDGTSVDNTHEWCADGVTSQIDNLQNLPTEMFPWWMHKLRNREVIHITDVSKMSEEAKAEKEFLENQDIKSLLVIPLISADKLAGFIGFDNVKETGEWSEEDLALLRTSSELIGNVLEHKRAEDELKSSREQLRNLTSYLQSVREEERRHIAREIHDELGQTLTALKMDISWLINKLPEGEKPLIEKTKSISKLIDTTIQTSQRILTELRPGLLDDLGLAAAIEWQAEEFQKRIGIKCKATLDPEEFIVDQDRSTAIFRIFQETLTNVARHANATRVRVNLGEKAGKLMLKVKDNGKGITEKQISDPKSFGLIGIQERVHLFGGEFKISGIRDKGTTVTVVIPLGRETR